jgi:type II secretory pathway pseudopilin PulG
MKRRQGFTIVELLVAMALIIFIMIILSEAFAAGLESFRQLKAIGDMQERMRSAAIIMRRDFQADHFDSDSTRGTRLSDQDMRSMEPPDKGFFRLWQVYTPTNPPAAAAPYNASIVEGYDGDGIVSTRATEHVLQFTVRLAGTRPENYFVGQLPWPPPIGSFPAGPGNYSQNGSLMALGPPDFQQPNSMVSQWAEVTYFLKPLLTNTTPPAAITANGTPLHALYRRQRLLGPDGVNTVVLPVAPVNESWEWRFYTDVSFPQPTGTAPVALNSPTSITLPTNRLGMNPDTTTTPLAAAGLPWIGPPPIYPGAPANPPAATGVWTVAELLGGTAQSQAGDDVLMTDVLSFDVKVLQQGYGPYSSFVDLPPSTQSSNLAFANASPAYPNGVSVFDTWSKYGNYSNWNTAGTATSLPLKIRILALQITLRVWDQRTQQTRQVTIIQDM